MRLLPLYQSRIYPVIRCTRGWTIDGTDCCVTFEVTRKVTLLDGKELDD